MTKEELEDAVFIEMTVDEIRNENEDAAERLDTALDEAQADVFSGDKSANYVIIKITK